MLKNGNTYLKLVIFGTTLMLFISGFNGILGYESNSPVNNDIIENNYIQNNYIHNKISRNTELSSPKFSQNEIIVEFADSDIDIYMDNGEVITGVQSIDTLNKKYNVGKIEPVFSSRNNEGDLSGLSKYYRIELEENCDIYKIIDDYNKDSNILNANLNYKVEICLEPNDPFYHSYGSWGQDYEDLYGLHLINSSIAWDDSTGSNDVIVAVIDTGIDYTHEDIVGNMWINDDEIPNNFIDDDQDGFIDNIYGADFGNNDGNPMDSIGHGTHCAGTIGAIGNNSLGVVGVNWNVKIMAVKGFSDFMFFQDISRMADALVWAVDNGAKVLSNSWILGLKIDTYPMFEAAVRYAYDAGCIVVFAAGNSNEDVQFYSPQNMDETITVAGINHQKEKAYFSSWGEGVDACAPAVDILSLRAIATDMYHDGIHIVDEKYYRANGTSMACPHVAGLAALLLSKNQNLTPDMVKTIIRNTADEVISPTDIGGCINAGEAIKRSPVISLLDPFENPTDIKGTVGICGTAWGEQFQFYTIEYSKKDLHENYSWHEIINSTECVEKDILAEMNTTNLDEGQYIIRLTVVCNDGIYQDLRSIVINNQYDIINVDSSNTEGPWDGSSQHPYQYIQDGMSEAGHQDSVFVRNGIYEESIFIDRSIDLVGENKNSVIIDGNGFGNGIFVKANNVNISGFTITNSSNGDDPFSSSGIYVISKYNNIFNNKIINNFIGIFLIDSSYNTILDNEIKDCIAGVAIASYVMNAHNNTIINNLIRENEVGVGITSLSIFFSQYYLRVSKNNEIINNTIIDNIRGISLDYHSSKNNISKNHIEDNDQGVVLVIYSNNNSILDNTIKNNSMDGIFIEKSSNENIIVRNTVVENGNGIKIIDNQYSGSSNNNLIFHNNFIDNFVNAYDECNNIWQNDILQQGNYWNDYEGIDTNYDGIGDTPYNISGGFNQDNYPLMGPYLSFDLVITHFSAEKIVKTISIESINENYPYKIKIKASVKNIGSADIDRPFMISFYVINSNTNSFQNNKQIGIIEIESLDAGDTAEITFYYKPKVNPIHLAVFADSTRVIMESNENNNWAMI